MTLGTARVIRGNALDLPLPDTANALIAHLETIRNHIADAFTTHPPEHGPPPPPNPSDPHTRLQLLRPQATEET